MPRTDVTPLACLCRILTRAILNANNGLFIGSDDSPTVQPNPLSHFNTGHLEYFKFVGRVVGKALADGQLLDVHFTRSFYKHMLGIPITYHVSAVLRLVLGGTAPLQSSTTRASRSGPDVAFACS